MNWYHAYQERVWKYEEGYDTLTNKTQSTEVLLEMVQTGKLLEKEVGNLKEDTNNLTIKTQSTEVLLQMVQTDSNLL